MTNKDVFSNKFYIPPQGDIVCQVTDEYGDIVVADTEDYRILRFEGINEQSKMLKKDVNLPVHQYSKAMLMATTFTSGRPALLLGLGGGALLRALHSLNDQRVVDVVELRSGVLSVAREWFTLPESDKISYYIEDAEHYLRRESIPQYDLIFSDLYSAFSMEPRQGTEVFLRLCLSTLSDEGWLVLNYYEVPRTGSAFHSALQAVFGEVLYCRVPSGNVVIYAARKPHQHTINERREQAKLLLSRLGIGGETGDLSKNITPLFP
ncbi:spermidine synthase [Rahnella woolbedingensis]|uniref:Spermidine synthase n=2 Tax=Rahnella woolbedingensis TaxID=1510574 RepID=A0A419NB06_9GAMM|nr:spermidine synthase [Rahnella woolbedingensis]